MKTEAVIAQINADEATFYAISLKAWGECSEAQKDFIKFNSTYTNEYIAAQIKAVQDAKELPNHEACLAVQTRTRAILAGKAAVCNNLVQSLYTIIARIYSGAELESMRRAAGSGYYDKAASGENWNDADTLYGMVAAFLVTNNEELLAGNMPATFPATFSEAQSAFMEAHGNYSEARDAVSKGAAAKNEANAAAHTSLMLMLNDGKVVYRNAPAKAKYFVYSQLKKMVGKPSKTGIRISLKQDITKLPVANASITLQPGNYTPSFNKKGIAIQVLPADTYTYTITAPGLATLTGTYKVKKGAIRRLNAVITKAEAPKPAETTTGNDSLTIKAS